MNSVSLKLKLPEVTTEFPNIAVFLTVDLHTASIEYTLILNTLYMHHELQYFWLIYVPNLSYLTLDGDERKIA
jgi:hypothetical protein